MKLDTYLKASRTSMVGLARHLGLSRWTIARYRRGERIPPPHLMRAFLDATGGAVTPADFLSEKYDLAGAEHTGASVVSSQDCSRCGNIAPEPPAVCAVDHRGVPEDPQGGSAG